MRNTTVTEKYNAVLEGSMAKKEFVRQMRQQFPMFVSNFDGFDSTVQILRTRNMIFEAAKPSTAKAKVYDEKPALTYSLDALDRGIRAELGDVDAVTVNAKDYLAAEKKAKANLEKNPTHYLDLISGESNKVDKHDREKEVKRGAGDVDTFNGMKKATLKEEIEEVDANPAMSEDAIKAMLGQVVGALRAKYPDITAGIVKDFIRTHYDDLKAGVDIETEFGEYISNNYEGPSDVREKVDQDKDGDNDFDDIKIARMKASGMSHDDAVKKVKGKSESYAMKRMQKAHTQDRLAGKKSTYDLAKEKNKEQEKQLKEAVKSIIKKTLTENMINEAATNHLSIAMDDFGDYSGAQGVINALENIVTEIESFYGKVRDKIQKVYDDMGGIENAEGLKIGTFIGPSIENAFMKDLRPVTKKGFTKDLQLPKAKRLDPEVVAQARAAGEIDETPEDTKTTVFTPNF